MTWTSPSMTVATKRPSGDQAGPSPRFPLDRSRTSVIGRGALPDPSAATAKTWFTPSRNRDE